MAAVQFGVRDFRMHPEFLSHLRYLVAPYSASTFTRCLIVKLRFVKEKRVISTAVQATVLYMGYTVITATPLGCVHQSASRTYM